MSTKIIHSANTPIHFASQNVMAIGDNANDLPMFNLATYKVAMGNATTAVKQAATIIAPSNDEEGVAWVLEHYVL